ncbi:MAG: YceD family protein [Rhodoferax sp.]
MKKESPHYHLDVKAFAQSSGALAGENSLSEYGRLAHETQGLGAENPLTWSARGELRTEAPGAEQIWLHLNVAVQVPLICQRCMTPVEIAVSVDRAFRFVGNEKAAEEEDPDSEEDVLVLNADFSLAELVEDEVLLDLPLIPKHDVCPIALKLATADPDFDTAAEQKRQPFAVLAQLKKGKPDQK